jgi:hypothetical protein
MEEESRDILMTTLIESGVSIPGDFTSVSEFTPEALVSICAQLLNLIDPSASFSDELPDSLPERFRICTDIAHSVKNLGYINDMSYYKVPFHIIPLWIATRIQFPLVDRANCFGLKEITLVFNSSQGTSFYSS